MGLPALADYIVGDPVVTPLSEADYYSEHIAQLPRCYLPNDSEREIAETPGRETMKLPEGKFVFCCFNAAYKFSPEVFDVWCKLLRELPDSVLWLSRQNPLAVANLRNEAIKLGVAPERLIFAERLPESAAHLGRLRLADLALDTLPYSSHATACDALWAGVPMVTCKGAAFASRVGASLLGSVGLSECITDNLEEYFSLAYSLAKDARRLGELRKRLEIARRESPLFDSAGFTRDLEGLYLKMWHNHCLGTHQAIASDSP
jgi:protein O-GlcNAc transferase